MIDSIDVQILDILQKDGRIQRNRIAEKVGLTIPAVSERMRKLEKKGIIDGYHAKVNHSAIGKDVTSFVFVMTSPSKKYDEFIPKEHIKKWKEAGIIVIPVVPSVAFARRLERSGADALIVEGTEAGGHIGELTTMALVPQVVDAVNIPVIAAGGIADHRGLDAVFVLGAKGVQIGTVLLASYECPIHENYKNKVIKAKDTDTVVTGRQTGAPVRVLKNKMAREYLNLTKYGDTDLEELEKLTLGSLSKAVFDGDLDGGSFMAGQSAGLVKEIRSVKEILEDIFEKSLVAKGIIK